MLTIQHFRYNWRVSGFEPETPIQLVNLIVDYALGDVRPSYPVPSIPLEVLYFDKSILLCRREFEYEIHDEKCYYLLQSWYEDEILT